MPRECRTTTPIPPGSPPLATVPEDRDQQPSSLAATVDERVTVPISSRGRPTLPGRSDPQEYRAHVGEPSRSDPPPAGPPDIINRARAWDTPPERHRSSSSALHPVPRP